METVISSDEDGDYLTEKVFKPIYRQHPFIIACSSPRLLETLHRFGFRTFSPVIDESYSDTKRNPRGESVANDCMTQLNQLHRLVHLQDSEWLVAEEAAEFNRHHLLCPSGFGAKLLEHSAALIRFAMELAGTRK